VENISYTYDTNIGLWTAIRSELSHKIQYYVYKLYKNGFIYILALIKEISNEWKYTVSTKSIEDDLNNSVIIAIREIIRKLFLQEDLIESSIIYNLLRHNEFNIDILTDLEINNKKNTEIVSCKYHSHEKSSLIIFFDSLASTNKSSSVMIKRLRTYYIIVKIMKLLNSIFFIFFIDSKCY
jgi:hypothetical protein